MNLPKKSSERHDRPEDFEGGKPLLRYFRDELQAWARGGPR